MSLESVFLPILILSISFADSLLTRANTDWYQPINPPIWSPNKELTVFILAVVGFLALISTVSLFFDVPNQSHLWLISGLTGAFFNNSHFNAYLISFSLIENLFFYLAMIALIVLTWKVSKFAAVLLIPYSFWYGYNFYLSFRVWQLIY